jgi:hypothetical protein
MAQPLDAVTAIHNAFRKDMAGIDAAALAAARGESGLEPAIGRYRFCNEILVWHALGEELEVFPALEAVAPAVAEAYERDPPRTSTPPTLPWTPPSLPATPWPRPAPRQPVSFHLDIHSAKEDAHLYG